MLRTIRLYGSLAEKYGSEFKLAVETPAEAIRALCVQLRGLERDISDGEWVCVRGDAEKGSACDIPLLHLRLGRLTEFHLFPAAMGAKGGIGKVIIGLALIAATVLTAGAALGFGAFGFGAGLGGFVGAVGVVGTVSLGLGTLGLVALGVAGLLVISGVAQMLAPTPKGGSGSGSSSADEKAGFLFNGAANTAQQGSACPLVFGRIRAGSVVVSAGITTERIGAVNNDFSSPTNPDGLTYVGVENIFS